MKRKIVIYIERLVRGGAEHVTANLANYFSNDIYDVVVVTTKPECNEEYKLNSNVRRECKKSIFELRSFLIEERPDIILVMFAPSSVRMSIALIGLNIPIIISERNDPNNYSGKKITKILYQICMFFSDGLIFQTKEVLDYYSFCKKPLKTILLNPIDINQFPSENVKKRRNVIVNVGRLHPQKEQKMLIKAFSEVVNSHPDYSLEIYGSGELKDEFDNYIKSLSLSNKVFLKGEYEDVLYRINDAQIFVLCSSYEGMPNALIEALCLGIPSISTDCPCGGPKELITDHINGTLIPNKDIQSLILAINELIENENIRNKYHDNSQKIRKKFSSNEIYMDWINFINKVCDNYYA